MIALVENGGSGSEATERAWVRIRWSGVVRLTEKGLSKRLRWVWKKGRSRTGPRLFLVSPRGVWWEFRLRKGAWMRRVLPGPGVPSERVV